MPSNRVLSVLTYLAGIVCSVFLFVWLICGFRFDPFVPLMYYGDVLFEMGLIRGLVQGDWYPFSVIHTSFAGAPFGLDLGHFPLPENLHFFFLKMISYFSSSPGLIYNAYFLLTYCLSTCTFVYAVRRFRVPRLVALGLGLLFAFLPFHEMRYAHLFLASYYVIPLCVTTLLWLWREKPLFFRNDSLGRFRVDLVSHPVRFAIITAILAGIGGVYYAFFFCFFVLLAGISSAVSRKSYLHLISAALLLGLTAGSLGLSILPNLIYTRTHGRNSEVAHRRFIDAEIYGLKIKNIATPRSNHRIPALAKIRGKYGVNIGGVEGAEESIGFVALSGLGILLLSSLFFRKSTSVFHKLNLLSTFAIIFSVVGGFAVIFAATVSAQIRCYNRISVFLACFGLFAWAFSFKHFSRRICPARLAALTFVLACFGLFDQATPDYANYQAVWRQDYLSDEVFFHQLDALLPDQTLILQLPFMAFPESSTIHQMTDYSHLRAFIHTHHLRWSYGAVRGFPGARIIEQASQLPLNLKNVLGLGYRGIYIDRFGFADKAKLLEEDLSLRLKKSPWVSPNLRFSFFQLPDSVPADSMSGK